MSLITRCPACETMFKVVPDQLRISEGWVRCGQCDEIFDASLHLLPTSPEEGTPAVQHEEAVANFNVMDTSDVTPPPIDVDLDLARQAGPDDLPVEQEPGLSAATEDDAGRSSRDPIADEFSQVDEVISLSMDWLEAQSDVPSAAPSTPVPSDQGANTDSDEPESDRISELSDVSFLQDKKTGRFWYKPFVRAAMVLLSLTLLAGLAGQIVFHERDRIVAWQPGLKPWLQAICEPLNCTLSPLRRIESIVIDSSSFSKIRGDSYRLNFTVKNTAVTALAVPAIELTLTDSLDQPIVRRVFLPPELGVKSDTLAAGSEWPASLAVAVKAGGMVDRVAGYRLLAFYP